jgi:hypothetical protein
MHKAYFRPRRELEIGPVTELYAGLVHYTDGVQGTRQRFSAARHFVSDFGVAPECG